MNIIPYPAQIEPASGVCALTANSTVLASGGAVEPARILAGWLRAATGFALAEGQPPAGAACIQLVMEPLAGSAHPEAYRLDVSTSRVLIRAATAVGLLHGAQTLRQLLPAEAYAGRAVQRNWQIPCVHIADAPRFGWRGMHLDVARHFMPMAFVRKFVEMIALHKFNVLHLHLTDDQGWRMEIKKYPRLTEVGAWRAETRTGHERSADKGFDGKRHGGFYTHDELRALVQHAASLGVTVMPEIEMPGHAQAAIAAYPELGNLGAPLPVAPHWGIIPHVFNVEESTLAFMQDVLTEVMDVFPSRYIHVGGDECSKEQWAESLRMQARIKELGLKDEHELQSYFIRRMDKFLGERGRVLVGWDEILEGGLADAATVMSWQGEQGGIVAAKAGHDVVMTPTSHTYFDYCQSEDRASEPLAASRNLLLETVYAYEPVPAELDAAQAKHVLGSQGQLWSEYIPTPAHCEYMAFPRACALAEVLWSPKPRRPFADFRARLTHHVRRLDALDVKYRKLD